jgi:hypothetical protein
MQVRTKGAATIDDSLTLLLKPSRDRCIRHLDEPVLADYASATAMASTQKHTRKRDFTWDIVKSADSFVILASILAAFAFAALVILTTTQQHAGSPVESTFAIQVLLEAFFSLVVASFLFAVLAGEKTAVMRYRPFALGYAASWTLALSTVQLCASAVWLLRDYGVAEGVLQTGRFIVYGAIGITSLSVIGVAVAPIFQHSATVTRRVVLQWLVPSALPAAGVLVGWSAHSRNWIVVSPTLGSWLAAASVAAVLLMAAVTGVLESVHEDDVAPLYSNVTGYLLMLLSIVLLAALYTAYVASLPGLG